ncbi:MAG: tetratricopeptide repeat protein [Syntrophales bacterium]|nr:tetratricopeptide repeat protein [Syntrophales bacterium]
MTDNEFKEKESFLAKAESFLAQGLYQTAQDLALDRLTRFPVDADARIIVCHAWTRMGKLDKVKQMLREVDEAILSMSRIYARMGDICRQSGLNSEAVAFYRKFITLNPDSSLAESVSEKLNSLLSSQEQTDISEEETDMEERRPVPGLKTVTMAELYLKQGHPDLAQEVLEECLKKDPANQRAAAMLGDIQARVDIKTTKASRCAPDEVVCKLSRWLNNMHRLRGHAA